MIEVRDKEVLLSTKSTSYLLSYSKANYLTCEYYGSRLSSFEEAKPLVSDLIINQGTELNIDDKNLNLSLNQMKLELSTLGRGDFFSPSLIIKNSRSMIFDFKVDKVEVVKPIIHNILPMPRDPSEELVICLADNDMHVVVELHYILYSESDIICRYIKVINQDSQPLHILKAMSMQLGLVNHNSTLVSYYGNWANELNVQQTKITHGRIVNESLTGSSSNRHNPFFIVKEDNCNAINGNCYGYNLIYSSNFEESVEMDSFSKIRVQVGINSTLFDKSLLQGESFVTPCALLSYSSNGYNKLSKEFQTFINNHIVKKKFNFESRPIAYNSWESCYYKYNKRKIKSLIRKASKLKMELFVLDDGWFANRNDDAHGLGDWEVNRRKLPGGLKSLANYAIKKKMKFGIWMEPEMVNENSRLYKNHPTWIIQDGIHTPIKGRNQYVLDLTKKEVQDFVFDSVSKVIESADISYVKWDYNRNISDMPNSGTFFYDYICGLYSVLNRIVDKYPYILFENCASGGNRFDLGMLSFFQQSWISDNTDSFKRGEIQKGARLGYPLSVMSNHVSGKTSNQLLRYTSLDSKFNVACFGILGYELNLCDLKPVDIKCIKKQILFYKKHRDVFQLGVSSFIGRDDNSYSIQAQHNGKIIAAKYYTHTIPNPKEYHLRLLDTEKNCDYSFYSRIQNRDFARFGSLINMVSPIHIKEDGALIHFISNRFTMDGEYIHGIISGKILENSGIALPMLWSGTGISNSMSIIHDFDSRLYVFEKC